MSSILLVSNGHGEAAIAGYIATAIDVKAPGTLVEHLPLVGKATDGAWPPAVGPQTEMPSGGLVTYGNARNMLSDIRAGLLGLSVRQFSFLCRQRKRDAVVAVGDVYCLALSLVARRPTVFVATAKSEFVAPHSSFECAIARRAAATFARDALTAQALQRRGVRAQWVGNLMMDGLAEPDTRALPVRADAVRFAVLPGSRRDAPDNARAAARRLRKIAAALADRGSRLQAFVSLAPSVPADEVEHALASEGLELERRETASGIVATATAPASNLEVALVRGRFAELLAASDIVLGQAGTANEQAAGMGRPVIAASDPGIPPQRVGWYRQRQQRLLGDALLVLPDDDGEFVRGVVQLLDDPTRIQRMAEAGRARMGDAGAAAKVAELVLMLAAERPS